MPIRVRSALEIAVSTSTPGVEATTDQVSAASIGAFVAISGSAALRIIGGCKAYLTRVGYPREDEDVRHPPMVGGRVAMSDVRQWLEELGLVQYVPFARAAMGGW